MFSNQDFKIIDFELNRTQFPAANVYIQKVEYRKNGHIYLMKSTALTKELNDTAVNEEKILLNLKHPNIVTFIGSFKEKIG